MLHTYALKWRAVRGMNFYIFVDDINLNLALAPLFRMRAKKERGTMMMNAAAAVAMPQPASAGHYIGGMCIK